jgi:hypothetical protein
LREFTEQKSVASILSVYQALLNPQTEQAA